MQCFSRLSLDPIDRSPFRRLMKFTQLSCFTFYFLGLSAAITDYGLALFRNWLGSFFVGWGWCYIYLNYYLSIQQILSELVVSVVHWVILVVGSNSTFFHTNLFFFQIEETCTFTNVSSLKYHLSVI